MGAKTMTHEEAAFEALAYRRNVGTTLARVCTHLSYRTNEKSKKRALQILQSLEAAGDLVSVGDTWFLTPQGYKRAKGSALPAEWQDADALIFFSLLSCRSKKGGLTDIIATADYLNHAIPTREELHGAINRLLSAQLVKSKGGTFTVTAKAEELMKKVEATCKRAMLSQVEGLHRVMDCPCCGVELKKVRWGYQLHADAYQELVKAYRATFA